MKFPRKTSAAIAGLLVLGGAPSAQSREHPHGAEGPITAAQEPHRRVHAVLQEADQVLASGRGFGMAFPADQNGYPGSMHALELRERLKLTAAQVTALEALTESMFKASRPQAQRLLDAEAELRRVFADGGATEARVTAAVANAERARGALRLVHLLTHVQTRDILTAEQRRLYHEIRWTTP